MGELLFRSGTIYNGSFSDDEYYSDYDRFVEINNIEQASPQKSESNIVSTLSTVLIVLFVIIIALLLILLFKNKKINIKNIIKKNQNRVKIKYILIPVMTIVIVLTSLFFVSYAGAAKKAENRVAYYMSQKTNDFLSFGKIYSTVSLDGFGYTVELSGTENAAINQGYKTIKKQFNAKIYIPLIGKASVKEIKVDNRRIY